MNKYSIICVRGYGGGGDMYGVLLETIFCRSFYTLYLTRFRNNNIARTTQTKI
jgi:hypothetical protein